MALERVLYPYKNKCVSQLHSLDAFLGWTKERLLHFTQDIRVRILNKDELVLNSGEFVKEWVFVARGKLRLERDTIVEKANYWPATHLEKKYCSHDFGFDSHKSNASWI